MKRFVSILAITTIALTTLTACSSSDNKTDESAETTDSSEESETSGDLLHVGMTTDQSSIDDKSFNQGTWEGIVQYDDENPGKIEYKYNQPTGDTKEDFITTMQNLIDTGSELVFAPGYTFETAIFDLQTQYPETKFVILDGYPHNGDYNEVIEKNTEAIFFAEEESGFYAGVVSALTSKSGKVSFIGGMEMPPVQKFGWGYVAGVAYANKNLGTDVTVADYVYQGTFTDVAAGKTLAAQFYDSGSDIVFSAAGGVGVGVIDEAKTRHKSSGDKEVQNWVIGVDVDQYDAGDVGDGTSVILTSAMKNLGQAAYTTIQETLDGKFRGGETVILDSKNNGVGLPAQNPNLSDDVYAKYEEVYGKVASEEIKVPESKEELDAFLTEYGYTTPSGIKY